MTQTSEHFQWKFGGWLQALPGWGAALVLLALLAAAFGVAWWSYRRTLQPLTAGRRVVLLSLRTAAIFLLLLCLANPTLVTRVTSPRDTTKHVAVVIDRSDSMLAPDNRNQTRLANALNQWRATKKTLGDTKVDYYALGAKLEPATDQGSAESVAVNGSGSAIYSSLAEILSRPEPLDEVICLTDGNDTTDALAGDVVQAALARNIPVSFLPAENRLSGSSYVRLREASSPARALQNTEITFAAMLEAYGKEPHSVPVKLLRNGEVIAEQTVTLAAGKSLKPLVFPVKTGNAGPLDLRLVAGDNSASVHASVQVLAKIPARVLFYQGALDWGYRFFARALSTDPSFQLTAIFSPRLGVTLAVSSTSRSLPDLPSSPMGMAQFDLIVLSQVFPDQLSTDQQNALADFVRQGGAVLFALSDAKAAQGFAGSALEQMLPVRFLAADREDREDIMARDFQARMKQTSGGSNGGMEFQFSTDQAQRPLNQPTIPFGFSEETPLADLLRTPQGKQIVPEYTETAHILDAKPGAQVLAMAKKSDADTLGGILLATQPFGYGRSAVLGSDMLWRWSLKQPSTSSEVETFWQQFVLWLAQPARQGLRFLEAAGEASLNQPARFVLGGIPGVGMATLHAISPSGFDAIVPLTLRPDASMLGEFRPSETGEWKIRAEGPNNVTVEKFLTVSEKPQTGEMNLLAADRAGMSLIAEATGGRLYDHRAITPKVEPEDKAPLVIAQESRPLWNSWLLFLPLLGLFGAELALRRFWKLL